MRLNENIHMASVSIKVCTDFRHLNIKIQYMTHIQRNASKFTEPKSQNQMRKNEQNEQNVKE